MLIIKDIPGSVSETKPSLASIYLIMNDIFGRAVEGMRTRANVKKMKAGMSQKQKEMPICDRPLKVSELWRPQASNTEHSKSQRYLC